MQRIIKFRKGDPVTGYTFDHQKIIGIYIRIRASFGVLVYGMPEGKVEDPKEYLCSRLTLESRKPPKPRQIDRKLKLAFGDLCTGTTPIGQTIIGTYANYGPKPFAFIRGAIAKDGLISPFDEKQTFKVLRSSLKKQA